MKLTLISFVVLRLFFAEILTGKIRYLVAKPEHYSVENLCSGNCK